MIGRLILSDRNIFKIKSTGSSNKQVSARKCNILSESTQDIVVKTNKEFNPKDEYVIVDPNTNTVSEGLGVVGDELSDLKIYYHLYTLGWKAQSQYKKLWENINTDFDLINTLDTNTNTSDTNTSDTNTSDINTSDTNTSDTNIIKTMYTRSEYHNQVITIDPIGSVDLDDGFSFSWDENNYYLDIHIADPVSLFDLTNPFMIKILYELYVRLQTCYIDSNPIKSIPTHLLPEQIVKLVSLLAINPDTNSNIKFRRAISFCFKISKHNSKINFELKFTKLFNIKNYTYDDYDNKINHESESELKQNLINLSNRLINLMDLKLNSIDPTDPADPADPADPTDPTDPADPNTRTNISHKMIEIFMILTNWYGGNYLVNTMGWSKTIIRTQNSLDFGEDFNPDKIPLYARPILSKAANYSNPNLDPNLNKHFTLGICNYAHLSSPMRRFIDMINHLGFYRVDLNTYGLGNFYDLDPINLKIKNYKKISNGYELVKLIKSSDSKSNNKFRACLFDWEPTPNTNKIKCLLVLVPILMSNQKNLSRVVSVELPQIELTSKSNIFKYMEFDVELYYNSNNFKSNKFPFSIKII